MMSCWIVQLILSALLVSLSQVSTITRICSCLCEVSVCEIPVCWFKVVTKYSKSYLFLKDMLLEFMQNLENRPFLPAHLANELFSYTKLAKYSAEMLPPVSIELGTPELLL